MGERFDARVGQVVEVRSEAEILATLDKFGRLDSLPFMPEMVQYCGQRFRIGKIANKLCDTMGAKSGNRRMRDAVHLANIRCDGAEHGGCEADCLIYWKTEWLRLVPAGEAAPEPSPVQSAQPAQFAASAQPGVPAGAKLLPLLVTNTTRTDDDGTTRYVCQVTQLLEAAPDPLPWKDLGQYVEDVRVGNVSVGFSMRAFLVGGYNRMQGRLPRYLRIKGGQYWRFIQGTLDKTPTGELGLKPGEWVRIKTKDEIVKTLNTKNLNRGLGFEAEMSRFCGRTARVKRVVHKIIDEPTGIMIEMKSPCVVLEDVVCEGAYNMNCPRGITPYWREIWLERVSGPA